MLAHELGHFLVAKRNGVGAEEFGFGFPPRIVGLYKDKNGKRRLVWGNKPVEEIVKKEEETVYSLNLIPIGGFVKITGQDGEEKINPKSFAGKTIWTRFKILFAGVGMNIILGVVFLAIAFQIGLPEAVDDKASYENSKIQIAQVVKGSPAEEFGIAMGDEIVAVVFGGKEERINSTEQFQNIIAENAGKNITLLLLPFGEKSIIEKEIAVRESAPEGQGLLGVVLVKTVFTSYDFFESFWLAIKAVFGIIVAIFVFLGNFLISIFSQKPIQADVAGPIGIAVLTGQVAKLGLAYVLQFTAMLSVNLAIINLLPLPALDGGRILFLLFEKIKGKPINQKIEGFAHMIGFLFLIGLMILITFKDFSNFQIIDKIKGIF